MVGMKRNLFRSIAVAVLLAMPVSALAQSPNENKQDPRELLEGATKMMLQALELMLNAIPQYEAPEVLENGDIIIRRKPQKREQPPSDNDSKVDQDKT